MNEARGLLTTFNTKSSLFLTFFSAARVFVQTLFQRYFHTVCQKSFPTASFHLWQTITNTQHTQDPPPDQMVYYVTCLTTGTRTPADIEGEIVKMFRPTDSPSQHTAPTEDTASQRTKTRGTETTCTLSRSTASFSHHSRTHRGSRGQA